jgi:diguanylate cyclase (GGDEF)-like protein/PAS domain S-box-containing protein
MAGDEGGPPPGLGKGRRQLSEHASPEALLDALLPAEHAVYLKDRDGRYLMVNAVAEANVGRAAEELVGLTDLDIFPDEAGERLRRTDEEVMGTGEPRTVEEPLVIGGRLRSYLSTKAPLRDSSGKVIGLVGVSTDVTSLKEADEEVRRREAHLVEAQALTGIGSWEWDIQSGNARWSDQIYTIMGRDPASLELTIEAYMECIHPDDRERVAAMAESVNEPGTSAGGATEYRIVRPDGEVRTVSARGQIFFDVDGTALRAVGAVQDVTEQRRAEQEMIERELQLSVAQELTGIGSWHWEPATSRVSWSAGLERIFGLEAGEFEGTLDAYMERVHPDDREKQRALVELTLAGEDVDLFDQRITRVDGEVRMLRSQMRVIRDEAGRPVSVIGASEDVTERRRHEQELELRARREALVSRIGRMALAGEDIRKEVSGLLAEELAVEVVELLHERDIAAGGFAAAALSAADPVTVPDWSEEGRFELPANLIERGVAASAGVAIRSYRGRWGTLAVHASVARVFDASELWLLESLSRLLGEALEQVRAGEEMRIRSLQDPLTGLANRTLLYDRLAHALDLARRRDSRLAVLFIDLDGFKVVNDELGHTAGDDVLSAAADRIRIAVRAADTLARVGGDEFVAVCEDMPSVTAALETAERVREGLAGPFATGSTEHLLSASVGIAFASSRHETPADIVHDADRAMYEAKEQGRDRVVIFKED